MRTLMRNQARILAGVILLAGCGAEDPGISESALETEAAKKPLMAYANAIWLNSTIPVCWETAPTVTPAEKWWVQDAIQRTWSQVSAVKFTGWGTCTSNAQGIRIAVADQPIQSRAYGRALNGLPAGMRLNFFYNLWNNSCRTPASRREACIRVDAVHEFGHALGFEDEQNHPSSTCYVGRGNVGNLWLEPYDSDSVMNFCNNRYSSRSWPYVLSGRDVRSVQALYGGKPGMIVGHLGKCLDRPNASITNGTLLQMWDCYGFDAQQWRIDMAPAYNSTPDNDYYRIVSRIHGGAVDDPGASNQAGRQVQYWQRAIYYNAQQFRFTNFMVRGHGGKCLNVPNGLNPPQTAAMFDCNGSYLQRWEHNASGKITIGNACLETMTDWYVNEGNPVGIMPCTFKYAQIWSLNTNGTITTPALPGKCLQVENWNTGPHSKVHMWTCNGGTNQRWSLRGRISHLKSPNLVLDVRNAINANGTPVQLFPFNGSVAQEWDYFP